METVTPLTALLRACTESERLQLAEAAGTTVNYLYSLAGCHRQQPKAWLAIHIEDASRKLNRKTRGRTPIVTVRDLAMMCPVETGANA